MNVTEEALYLLDKHLAPSATYILQIDRDSNDEYRFLFDKLQQNGPSLNRQDALKLIPTGSKWSHLIGWRSFFGLPIVTRKGRWLMLGVETAAPHPSRGAYLVFKAYLFPFPLSDAVWQTLAHLTNEISSPQHDAKLLKNPSGLVETHSPSSSAHRLIEGEMMRVALHAYRENTPFHFRTLATQQGQIERKGKAELVALVPSVARHFPIQPARSRGCFSRVMVILIMLSLLLSFALSVIA